MGQKYEVGFTYAQRRNSQNIVVFVTVRRRRSRRVYSRVWDNDWRDSKTFANGILALDTDVPWKRKRNSLPPLSLHFFDSFKGMPKVDDEIDGKTQNVVNGIWEEGTLTGLTCAQLRENCERYLPADRIHMYEGFFEDTFKNIPATENFCVVHVDCDLYVSTIQILDYLFSHEHVTMGSIILFDDWNCNAGNPKLGGRKA